MDPIRALEDLRAASGAPKTVGLDHDTVRRFLGIDPTLGEVIAEAVERRAALSAEFADVLALDEVDQIAAIQADYVNFYADDAVNPFVALAAKGPWIVSTTGAVIHDSGGYGMLGFGHAPGAILEAMNQPHVMANIMTSNFSQLRVARALRKEIGHGRDCPFARFIFMNSGSEAVTVAARIADVNAKLMTDPGGRHAGKRPQKVAISGGFHGRTDRAARYSDSTRLNYEKHLASYQKNELWTVAPNDADGLRELFARADRENVFIEALFMEPVMGEGNPGYATTPEFYTLARELTREHGTLLLIDSIQAGLRAQGCLSIVDYPGFEKLDAPDFETYSKALNGGQYPLSVLALTEEAALLYRKGIYGNTMTSNPRAMDVACAVLESVHAGAAGEHSRAGRGVPREADRPPEGARRPDHRRPGHRPALQLRARRRLQSVRRRQYRRVDADGRSQRHSRGRELPALHAVVRDHERGGRPDRRRDARRSRPAKAFRPSADRARLRPSRRTARVGALSGAGCFFASTDTPL